MEIVLLIFLLILLYTSGLYYWNKHSTWRLQPTISRAIKIAHYITLSISFCVAVSYSNYGIGLRGFWTTRAIVIFTLLTGIFFCALASKAVLNKFEKWYFRFFSWLPIIAGAFLFVPFLGIVRVFSLLGQLFNPVEKVYFEDDTLRVQSAFVSVLTVPKLQVYEKMAIAEKSHLEKANQFDEIDSIGVSYDRDSTRIIIFRHGYDKGNKTIRDTISLPKIK